MIRFLISLPAPLQLRLSQEARSTFLKDPEALRIHYGDQDQEQEEERDGEETVANGENLGLGQEDFQEEEEDRDLFHHLVLLETQLNPPNLSGSEAEAISLKRRELTSCLLTSRLILRSITLRNWRNKPNSCPPC